LFCGIPAKDVLQGKLFQRCTHLLYCSVPSLGGNVNTRRMSKPDVGSIFHIKNQWNILVIRNYYMNYQNYQNLMLLTSSDTKQTLMHLFLFTNSAQRELVSMCTQSIHDRNKLSLHYTLWSLQAPWSVLHSYTQSKRLPRRLYKIHMVCFLISMIPFNCKLVSFLPNTLQKTWFHIGIRF